MRRRGRLYRAGIVVAVSLMGAGSRLPAESGKADDQAAKPKISLDRLTHRIETETLPDGRKVRTRSFKKGIPWNEYLEALEAERGGQGADRSTDGSGSFSSTSGGEISLDAGSCTPPADGDFDADSFTATTTPPDERPLRQGAYVADRPKVTAAFTSYIEPAIDYRFTGQTEIKTEFERFHEDDVTVTTTVHDQLEITSKFNTGQGIKLNLGFKDKLPFISLGDASIVFETERKRSYTWTRDSTRKVQDKFTSLRSQKESGTITVAADAGKVTGQVTLQNLSDYPLDLDVSNVVIAVVAYSPFTGVKHAVGDKEIADTFHLGFGEGNNTDSRIITLTGLNTLEMMDDLAEGWVFDFELAGGFTAVDRATGNNVSSRISLINGSNARISIMYGDGTARQWGQVSVFQPDGACLTPRDMLTQYVGAANAEFEQLPDGTTIVKRINHKTNRHADQDFDSLTPEQQAEYGRWVVGFRYAVQPLTQIDLDNTLLLPEDKVYFYFVTAQDFRDELGPEDFRPSFAVSNNASAPTEQLVINGVSTNDLVELRVRGEFQIEEAYSQYVGTVNACGTRLYGATYYGHRVKYDWRNHNVPIPDADYYGFQVKFGGLSWMSMATLMANASAQPKMVSFRGFPYYDFTVQFRASPSLLAAYPTRNLQVRNAKPRQSFPQVGYRGYDVAGRLRTCYHTELGGYFVTRGEIAQWYQLNTTDLDLDGYPTQARTGLDFDDANSRRFPFAPEHLDGLDNNGNGSIDENPLRCPVGLRSYEAGTCRIDDRMGWYGTAPNVTMDRRFRRTDGTFTAWEAIGSVTVYNFTMTSDPALAAMEVRLNHYPPGGGAFSGSNLVNHDPGGVPPVPPLFSVGQEIQAEDGLLTDPMGIYSSGPDVYVTVPAGTPNFATAAAEYRVQVTQPGDYHVWNRVYAANSGDDSILVELLDPAGQLVNFGYGGSAHFRFERASPAYTYGSFGWTRVGHWNVYVTPEENVNPILYHLNVGTYTVRVRPRELGARLDRLRVDRYCPDADGDGYTICNGDCNDSNAAVRPGGGESCSTSYDDDCDGFVNEGCGGGGSPIYVKVVE